MYYKHKNSSDLKPRFNRNEISCIESVCRANDASTELMAELTRRQAELQTTTDEKRIKRLRDTIANLRQTIARKQHVK